MLEAKGWTIELQLQDMIERPSLYAHLDDSRHTLLWLALLEADRKWIVWPKNSHRPKLDKLRELERAAGVAIGRMKIEIANTLPVWIERIRFMTIWKVKVTLWGELI